jgi:hypothetical protein
MSYANLARSSVSSYWAVGSVFSYLKRYKAKPKVIVALMPDFYRFMTVANPFVSSAYLGERAKVENEGRGIFLANHWVSGNIKDTPKYLEKPFPPEYTTSRETAFMQNIRAIQSLEAYCEVAGIKFLWSTWAPRESTLFSNIKRSHPEVVESFIDVKTNHWHSDSSNNFHDIYHENPDDFGIDWSGYGNCGDSQNCSGLDCHKELQEKYGENFYRGTDVRGTDVPSAASHFGVHRHTHYAEEFLKALKYGA